MGNDVDRWNIIKKATDATDETARLYFREGEVWWVRLGKNIRYETDGKSREFTRPAIIRPHLAPLLTPPRFPSARPLLIY
jgi:hypothetical protein